jgi:septum formation protein
VLLLASRSPRRAALLAAASIPFEQGPAPDVDETPPPGAPPEEAVEALALRKALAAAPAAPGRWVLAADTLVFLGGRILGKPKDPKDAAATLALLSGRTHLVATGVALARARSSGPVERHVGSRVARVTFRPLAEAEIRAYVRGGEPLDKAGSYALQGGAAGFVAALDGDPETVVGLPTSLVRDLLARATEQEPGATGR